MLDGRHSIGMAPNTYASQIFMTRPDDNRVEIERNLYRAKKSITMPPIPDLGIVVE